ncbi:peptidase domain-containing ABC transporter [Sunxiuqinia dokdonensis]|uniref:ABC transporter ATP-binding protein n=1 Tax=Sunxiuqinia dokdonensis TaxID=1409788 RepID=A0A0L8V4A9_9BACT|nr:peptidase domain-containing ABC transporter [Sunxiuqinia dokdonensis]KOH43325.1 ABC transporter ATP-binding protein [Sunxiuqinia dokdonensis]
MKRFPHYKQPDAMDCGPTALRIVAKYYGKHYNLHVLRELTYKSREGVSLLSLSDAAEKIGFRTQGVRLGFEQLEEATFPCILHWNQNHFVVVYKIRSNRSGAVVFISDPAVGLLQYSKDEFLRCWASTKEDGEQKGIALFMEPTPDFYSEKGEKVNKAGFRYLLKYIKPYRRLILQLILGFLTGSLLSLILPFLTQAIVDVGIATNNLNFIVLVLVAQLVLTISQTAVGFVRSWIMLHVSVRVGISLISDFLIKLMKLPIRFFDTKMIGDLRQRIDDNQRIQSFLTGNLISMSFGVFMFIIYSFIMAYYDLRILLVFYAGSILYVTWILLFLKRRKEIDYKRFAVSADNQSNIYQLITGMQEIKLNSCEKQKRWEWERIQTSMFRVSIKGLMLQQNQQAGSVFINQAKNILISFISAKAVIEGDLTLGMMVAVQYIIGQLNSPINEFIGFIQTAQDAKISLERLGEIHEREEEEPADMQKIEELPVQSQRTLKIENLSFHYEGPRSPRVLKDINLTIPENKITAIVGASGSGKTTLLKLLLGFYPPNEGKISLGDIEFQQFSMDMWRKKCGTVMQDGYIFSDTIANNIAVADDIPDKDRLFHSVTTANIREYIEGLPLRYNTKIGQEGVGLSQGQKQRILIARAVYKNPEFLFFDEATNALDANNEKEIMSNLDEFFQGKTVVTVAHRLSTVKNADQIIVLDKGEITEIGTHSELVDRKGTYYNLVKNQLELGS